MSSVPSYTYAGLDTSTRELQEELEQLGGGERRAPRVELRTVIDDLGGRSKSHILWQLENFVGLKDPSSHSSASASSMAYYAVSGCESISEMLSTRQTSALHEELVYWVMEGFNACLLADGSKRAGKTISLFGPSARSVGSKKSFPKALVRRAIETLYSSRRALHLTHDMSIGISCWALRRNNVVDLCDPEDKWSSAGSTKTFVIVDCQDESTALRVIQTARAHCSGVEAIESDYACRDSERAHFFMRITVFRSDNVAVRGSSLNSADSYVPGRGRVSHLHIVDLVGMPSVDDREFNALSEEDREARREVFLQHQALSKVRIVYLQKSCFVCRYWCVDCFRCYKRCESFRLLRHILIKLSPRLQYLHLSRLPLPGIRD